MNKSDQIGCGYCANEDGCKIRDPKVNKAKQGCPDWRHWEDDEFECCDECDLPDACSDFGCAIKAGIKSPENW